MEVLLAGLVFWWIAVGLCIHLAQSKGRSRAWALIWGVLFSWIAVGAYLIFESKKEKSKR